MGVEHGGSRAAPRTRRSWRRRRDPAVPAQLREEAAREIFERLDLWGPNVVAVYPRAEHAWLLGMAATRGEDLVAAVKPGE
jgi:hypothetical protein